MVGIRRRLLVVVPVIVCFSAALLAASVTYLLRSGPLWSEESDLRGRAEGLARIVLEEARSDPAVRFDSEGALRTALENRFPTGPTVTDLELEGLKITVTDDLGRIIFDREGPDYQSSLLKDDPTTVVTVSVPLFLLDFPAGKLFLSKGRAEAAGAAVRREKIIVSAVSTAAAVTLILVLLTILWATRPVTQLVKYAGASGEGEELPPPDLAGDELEGVLKMLQEARKSIDGTQYVEKYVQTLTHEMKSPLSVLRGASELLEEEMSDEQRAVFVKNIRKETDRIQELVDRLLQLSAIEGRRGLRDVESIELAPLVREVVDGAGPLLEGREIAPDLDLDDTAVVEGERFLLRQALANVLKNAVEFSPTGGALGVRLKVENDTAVITFDDAGPGVPEYALDRIFEKFYSLGRPDTGRRSSGLGLPFARETALLHGGSIAVGNMAGGGVRVRMTLPLAV
jgi:two-component system sensor histidine kinase CreC